MITEIDMRLINSLLLHTAVSYHDLFYYLCFPTPEGGVTVEVLGCVFE